MRQKAAIETWHIEQFLRLANIQPEGTLEIRESPDRRFRYDGKVVGLEHTRFLLPPSPGQIAGQQRDGLQEFAIEEARRVFRAGGGPALYVSPIMSDSRGPRTKQEAYELGRRFAAVVHRNGVPEDPGGATFQTWGELPEMHAYVVMKSVDGTDELWHPGSGGWVASVEPTMVQDCLARKTGKYEVYAQAADEVWLLIVNDIFARGDPCEIGAFAQTAIYETPFERVYWLETGRGSLLQLQVKGTGGA